MLFIYIFATVLAIWALIINLNGAIFVPTDDKRLKTMLKLAKAKQGEKIIDLGCGDGKILLALAQKGLRVEGVDINPLLLRRYKNRAQKMKLDKYIHVYRKSMWRVNMKDYDLVFIYGMSHIMRRLEKKLRKELKPGARVVSNYFEFPYWKPEVTENNIRVYRA